MVALICIYVGGGFKPVTALHLANLNFSIWQISGALQSTQSRKSEAGDILQKKELWIGGGGRKAAPQIIRCRPFMWPRHGQQGKWADLLRWCPGLWISGELCRGLQDGGGQLQVQWFCWGEKRSSSHWLFLFHMKYEGLLIENCNTENTEFHFFSLFVYT